MHVYGARLSLICALLSSHRYHCQMGGQFGSRKLYSPLSHITRQPIITHKTPTKPLPLGQERQARDFLFGGDCPCLDTGTAVRCRNLNRRCVPQKWPDTSRGNKPARQSSKHKWLGEDDQSMCGVHIATESVPSDTAQITDGWHQMFKSPHLIQTWSRWRATLRYDLKGR